MNRLEKTKSLSLNRADAVADIGLINQYSVKELTPEEVYCFSLVLCDNDIDRDLERFTSETLRKLAPLFVGKTGIRDHFWSSEGQLARLYRVEIEDTGKKNSLGEALLTLRGSAYMLRNDNTQHIIEAIDGGILKEVSVGCSVERCTCSICGDAQRWDWRSGAITCESGHMRGEKYDGKLCFGELESPTDAFEFSFVAVPAQRSAGVSKGVKNLDEAFELLMSSELSEHAEKVAKLFNVLKTALASEDERRKRAEIIAENDEILKKIKTRKEKENG